MWFSSPMTAIIISISTFSAICSSLLIFQMQLVWPYWPFPQCICGSLKMCHLLSFLPVCTYNESDCSCDNTFHVILVIYGHPWILFHGRNGHHSIWLVQWDALHTHKLVPTSDGYATDAGDFHGIFTAFSHHSRHRTDGLQARSIQKGSILLRLCVRNMN